MTNLAHDIAVTASRMKLALRDTTSLIDAAKDTGAVPDGWKWDVMELSDEQKDVLTLIWCGRNLDFLGDVIPGEYDNYAFLLYLLYHDTSHVMGYWLKMNANYYAESPKASLSNERNPKLAEVLQPFVDTGDSLAFAKEVQHELYLYAEPFMREEMQNEYERNWADHIKTLPVDDAIDRFFQSEADDHANIRNY